MAETRGVVERMMPKNSSCCRGVVNPWDFECLKVMPSFSAREFMIS